MHIPPILAKLKQWPSKLSTQETVIYLKVWWFHVRSWRSHCIVSTWWSVKVIRVLNLKRALNFGWGPEGEWWCAIIPWILDTAEISCIDLIWNLHWRVLQNEKQNRLDQWYSFEPRSKRSHRFARVEIHPTLDNIFVYRGLWCFSLTHLCNTLELNCLYAPFCRVTAWLSLRGYCTPGPYFWRLCAFSQKIKQLRTKYPMDLDRNVPRN